MPDDRRVLEGIDRLVVDGTNVLHALQRGTSPEGGPGRLPAAALIGRLRAMVPPAVQVIVVLDGSPEHGLVSRRIASGVDVRYSGRATADEAIEKLALESSGPARPGGSPGAVGLLVVTDDIDLAAAVRAAGGRTVRNGWLIDRLERQRLSAPAPGRPVSPVPPASSGHARAATPSATLGHPRGATPAAGPSEVDADGRRWSPGRGATRKRGNPKRGH